MDPAIATKISTVKRGFETGKTLSYEYRISQLQALKHGVQEQYEEIVAALHSDLHRSRFMSRLAEAEHVIDLIDHTLRNLKQWMRDESREMPILMLPGTAYVHYEPLGVVLVMGSWNFPFNVTLGPLVSAIAAGNAAIVKPSEIGIASSKVISSIISHLDQDCFQVVTGGVDVASYLTSLKWDLICFTGSTAKGRLVAKAAAETMTPSILELGGKNPVIVDRDANLQNAALRIVQGRMLNAGQVCVCPEYVFVHKDVQAEFERLLLATVTQFFGPDPAKSDDFERIISNFSTERVAKLLTHHGGEVLCGGGYDVASRYVAPTIIKNPDVHSLLMTEEVFGPVLSLLTFQHIDECVKFINSRDKPLALYYFGSINKAALMSRTRSGGFVQNETINQCTVKDLTFGGVGGSGWGRYQGVEGFRCLSNLKSICEKDTYNGYPVSLRYPPHTEAKSKSLFQLKSLTNFSIGQLKTTVVWATAVAVFAYGIHQGYIGTHTLEACGSLVAQALSYAGVKS